MSMITLHNTSHPEVTILSNTFIDNYMPEANGEFVKVYIYLLRALSSAPVSFSLEQMADRLLCTERDILRALKYWAKQELLALDFTDTNNIKSELKFYKTYLNLGKYSKEDEEYFKKWL